MCKSAFLIVTTLGIVHLFFGVLYQGLHLNTAFLRRLNNTERNMIVVLFELLIQFIDVAGILNVNGLDRLIFGFFRLRLILWLLIIIQAILLHVGNGTGDGIGIDRFLGLFFGFLIDGEIIIVIISDAEEVGEESRLLDFSGSFFLFPGLFFDLVQFLEDIDLGIFIIT